MVIEGGTKLAMGFLAVALAAPAASAMGGYEPLGPAAATLAFQTAIVDDAIGNGNGVVDSNETFRLLVRLKNSGTVPMTSMTATLGTSTQRVTISQASSIYGTLAPGSIDVSSTPFVVTTASTFVCRTTINFTLAITSGQGPASIPFSISTGATFNGTQEIWIPDNNAAGIDLPIVVSGHSGALTKVTAAMFLMHSFDGDLQIRLIGPDSTSIMLSNRRGGSGYNFGTDCPANFNDTLFDDAAAVSITTITSGGWPFAGTYRPEEPLAAFDTKSGSAVNGTWKLHVADLAAGGIGKTQCASVTLTSCGSWDGSVAGIPPEVSDDGARPLRATLVGENVDIQLEDVSASNTNLYVSKSPVTHPFLVSDPSEGKTVCSLVGVTSIGGGMKQATGVDLEADLVGAAEVLYFLVTADNGAATEGALGADSTGVVMSATAYCAR